VDADALTDGYIVRTKGTRYLSNKNQAFQRILALYPFMNGNPMFDQYELNNQLLDMADAFPNRDRILKKQMAEQVGMMPAVGGEPGGLAAEQNIMNPARSVARRSTREPGTGRQVEANPMIPAGVAL